MRHHPQLFATMPLGVLVMTVCAILPGDAEAIDCTKVSSFNEQTICGDKKLLLLDRDLTVVYNEFIKVFSDTGHYTYLVTETKIAQKKWLQGRNACGADAACVKAAYEERLAVLQRKICYPRDDSPSYQTPSQLGSTTTTTQPETDHQGQKPKEPAAVCSSDDRVDYDFIKKNEGAMLDFYVPGAFNTDIKTGQNLGPKFKRDKNGDPIQKAIASSGVTVGQGVDLGQQTVGSLRRYMNIEAQKYGKLADVDIGSLMTRINPFIGLRKDASVAALNEYYKTRGEYPTLTTAEADFISSAVKHGYAEDAAALFNKNSKPKMNFWSLPAAVQTTLTDMKYHAYIQSVVQHYYRGDWQKAAEEFRRLSTTAKWAKFEDRFLRRAKILTDAINNNSLPKQGDPCTPKPPAAINRTAWWENPRRPRWA
ncbi:MAG: pesticin C-terminus-like muramidase [Acidithiobacillus sp.]